MLKNNIKTINISNLDSYMKNYQILLLIISRTIFLGTHEI